MGSVSKWRAGLLALAATALAGAVPATAAPARVSAQAKAVTVRPLSLLKTHDLDFGAIIPGVAGGSITINPVTDAATYSNGAMRAGGTTQAARLVGGGTANTLVMVSWTPGTVRLRRAGAGVQPFMDMDTIRTNAVILVDYVNRRDPRIIGANRTLDIRFGGTLRVGANQAEGDYQGSFEVTVDYP